VALVVAGSSPVAHPKMMCTFLKIFPIIAILVVSGCAKDTPGYPEYNVGVGLFQAGEYESAAEHFQKAVEENPSFAEAYMNLGTSLYRIERFNEAMEAYKKADSLFRAGVYVEVRGTSHEEKVSALHEMMEVTDAQIRLLDQNKLSDDEIEELKRKIGPD
jgi:tetratricopeptide (TPR) repeat protein